MHRGPEIVAVASLWLLACDPAPARDEPPVPDAGGPDAGAPSLASTLPDPGQAFAPSRVRLAGDPADLAHPETCAPCHAEVVEQWSGSAHARSSFDNPWYRASVEEFRGRVGLGESRACGGCHDPVLLFDGAMDAPIAPDDPRAHAGIGCMICHGAVEARSDGNASLTIDARPVPLPAEGDPTSLDRHLAAVAPAPLRTARLCGSCHRGSLDPDLGLPAFLSGMDDLGPMTASAHGGSHAERVDTWVAERDCRGCHMPAERRGGPASHRFAGGHTPLAAQGPDPEALEHVRRRLREAAVIDVARASEPAPGAPIAIEVIVRNTGTGHRFPGGARDTHDTWIEVTVTDATGRLVAEAGTAHERLEDPTAHVLRSVVLDADGHPEEAHRVSRFHAPGYDHTIPPRDARLVRYEGRYPERLDAPLRIEATLRHRRHGRGLRALACASSRSARGRAFDAAAAAAGRAPLDGCAPQPVTTLSRAAVHVGPGADARRPEGGADRPAWLRRHDHALALSHDVQERLHAALEVVDLGLADAARAPERDLAEGALLTLRARIEARRGRWREAERAATEARARLGDHPAIDATLGDAYARVWRFEEAAAAYRRAVDATPGDRSLHERLATALGSLGRDAEALAAARRGLELAPRTEALLRTQALSLRDLGAPGAQAAHAAWLAHRGSDDAPGLRRACGREVPGCEARRQPVPRIALRGP